MAKKSKKYEAEELQAAVETQPEPIPQMPEPEATVEQSDEPQNNGQFQPKPAFHLEHDGTQYKFTRFPLPKRAGKIEEGDIQVTIDGEEQPAWITASRGWAADDKTIEYIWFDLENAKGYITLDYGVSAQEFNGAEFTRGDGEANRKDPVRVPKDQTKEDNRKALAASTVAKKRAAKEEEPEEVDEENTEE